MSYDLMLYLISSEVVYSVTSILYAVCNDLTKMVALHLTEPAPTVHLLYIVKNACDHRYLIWFRIMLGLVLRYLQSKYIL